MASNVEIKARVADRGLFEQRAMAIAGEPVALIEQDDTFFACTRGRLKLRDFCDGQGELIAYERADEAGPKTSSYTRSDCADPGALRDTLACSLGVTGCVRKTRVLYRSGRTRIHLDHVERLGDYMELEVMLVDDETPDAGMHEARTLMYQLGVRPDDLCNVAYVDLLARAAPDSRL